MNAADRVRAALVVARFPALVSSVARDADATPAVVEAVARSAGFPVSLVHYQSIYTGKAVAMSAIFPKG